MWLLKLQPLVPHSKGERSRGKPAFWLSNPCAEEPSSGPSHPFHLPGLEGAQSWNSSTCSVTSQVSEATGATMHICHFRSSPLSGVVGRGWYGVRRTLHRVGKCWPSFPGLRWALRMAGALLQQRPERLSWELPAMLLPACPLHRLSSEPFVVSTHITSTPPSPLQADGHQIHGPHKCETPWFCSFLFFKAFQQLGSAHFKL